MYTTLVTEEYTIYKKGTVCRTATKKNILREVIDRTIIKVEEIRGISIKITNLAKSRAG